MSRSFFASAAAWLLAAAAGWTDQALVLPANMEVLRCKMPGKENRFLGSNAPGQIFFPGEPVDLKLALTRRNDRGSVELALEIQEITTRDPARKIQGAFTDTAGNAPLVGLEGKPIVHRFRAAFDDKPEKEVEVQGVAVPARFGAYAVVLLRGGERQFLWSSANSPRSPATAPRSASGPRSTAAPAARSPSTTPTAS